MWALVLTPVLLAIHWYLLRADSMAVSSSTGWLPVTGPPLDAVHAFLATFVLLGLVPAALAPIILGRRPQSLGLGLGNVKFGVRLLALGVPLAVLGGFVGARSEAVAAVYPLGQLVTDTFSSFAPHAAAYLLYYLGFEYLFRGFLLLGLSDRIGPAAANVLQAALVMTVHFGKPGLEMAAALPASLAFGWLTLRTGSIWYAVAIHWVVGVTLDWFLVFGR